jgi:hypothetical protein
VNHRLKTQHAADINEWLEHDKARDREIHLPETYSKMLNEGHVGHLTNPFEDFCLTIQKHEHPEED